MSVPKEDQSRLSMRYTDSNRGSLRLLELSAKKPEVSLQTFKESLLECDEPAELSDFKAIKELTSAGIRGRQKSFRALEESPQPNLMITPSVDLSKAAVREVREQRGKQNSNLLINFDSKEELEEEMSLFRVKGGESPIDGVRNRSSLSGKCPSIPKLKL